MAKINILDSSVYNLIAAGEVVERPASVIKELIENSIDAGAKNITVKIISGGINQILVNDDGCGIEKEYLVNAFLPHATSKISNASDLDNILSLGFRGEALASIAAVSNVKLTSKVANSELGNCITLSAGKILSNTSVGASDGTTIIVSDLFFNVPARAKFLKKPKTEEQEITNMVERFVLANPQIHFNYYADGKQILSSMGESKKEALYAVYGKQVLTETLEISSSNGAVSVDGYIGRPSFSKANRTYQTIVVNGRYVNNATIATAVTNAYGELLMKRRYPFFVLYLTIDPQSVDVNVHPNKMEVRFENSGHIFSLVYEAVSKALSNMDYILQIDTSTGEVIKGDSNSVKVNISNEYAQMPQNLNNQAYSSQKKQIDKLGINLNKFSDFNNITEDSKVDVAQQIVTAAIDVNDQSESMAADNFGLGSKLLEQLAKSTSKKTETYQERIDTDQFNTIAIKTIGQLFNTYILIEYGNNLYMIDQHAAHERILYEKFTKQVENKNLVVQPLMFPYTLTLNSLEYNLIANCLEEMQMLGFDIVEFGDTTFKISSVPMLLADINFEQFFSEFLKDTKGNLDLTQASLIKEKLMQHSCKSAIKGGEVLTQSEIVNLFKDMDDRKIPLFCPHGRPIAVRVTKEEIEKWFKRIV